MSHLRRRATPRSERTYTSVSFSDPLARQVWERSQAWCFRHGLTMSSLVIEALDQYLAVHGQTTAKPPRPTSGSSTPEPPF